jgi:hypothetical protein
MVQMGQDKPGFFIILIGILVATVLQLYCSDTWRIEVHFARHLSCSRCMRQPTDWETCLNIQPKNHQSCDKKGMGLCSFGHVKSILHTGMQHKYVGVKEKKLRNMPNPNIHHATG